MKGGRGGGIVVISLRGKAFDSLLQELEAPLVPNTSYEDQSREPSFHSWIKPRMRINVNRVVGIENICWVFNGDKHMGINSIISMSNTRNKTARRKNRIEKGNRAEALGSKPHSNGEDFSRSLAD